MKGLEKRRGELDSAMAAASADHEELARIGSELATLQGDLTELEEQWLALAEEAEGR